MEIALFDRPEAQPSSPRTIPSHAPVAPTFHPDPSQVAEAALGRRTKQTVQNRKCPHCAGNNVVLHGADQNRRQRFKCRGCRRTYNILTGTPMARARKPRKWGAYLFYMTDHMPLRTIVRTGIGINLVTAWRWRHRFLEAAVNDNAPILAGVIEADRTFFQRSFKGSRGLKKAAPPGNRAPCRRGRGTTPHAEVPVLTALDEGDAVFDAVLEPNRSIESALDGRIVTGSVLCSVGGGAYANVARKANAEHYIVSQQPATPERRPGRLGLARVRAYHQMLKYLVNDRCRGVATKYLGNYLGWQRAMIKPGFKGKDLLDRALA